MINTDKTTKKRRHFAIAGMHPADNGIEFQGIPETKKVLWLQHGSNHYFKDLPEQYYNLLNTAYLNDKKAYEYISKIHQNLFDQVELYTYYMYGGVDGTPDILNGKLSASENYRHSKNCPSLSWNKEITIDNYNLSPREIIILDELLQNQPDKAIWDIVNLSESHFNTVKRNLLHNTNCTSSKELIIKAIQQNVILNNY